VTTHLTPAQAAALLQPATSTVYAVYNLLPDSEARERIERALLALYRAQDLLRDAVEASEMKEAA
jgi:hypothetical protein